MVGGWGPHASTIHVPLLLTVLSRSALSAVLRMCVWLTELSLGKLTYSVWLGATKSICKVQACSSYVL